MSGVAIPGRGDPVDDTVLLYRLIPANQCDVVDGQWVFQSGAFDNSSGGDDMSIVLDDTLVLLDREPEQLVSELADWGVAKLITADMRGVAQEVERSPRTAERAHGDVLGKKPRKRRQRIKAKATWVIEPRIDPAEGPPAVVTRLPHDGDPL